MRFGVGGGGRIARGGVSAGRGGVRGGVGVGPFSLSGGGGGSGDGSGFAAVIGFVCALAIAAAILVGVVYVVGIFGLPIIAASYAVMTVRYLTRLRRFVRNPTKVAEIVMWSSAFVILVLMRFLTSRAESALRSCLADPERANDCGSPSVWDKFADWETTTSVLAAASFATMAMCLVLLRMRSARVAKLEVIAQREALAARERMLQAQAESRARRKAAAEAGRPESGLSEFDASVAKADATREIVKNWYQP